MLCALLVNILTTAVGKVAGAVVVTVMIRVNLAIKAKEIKQIIQKPRQTPIWRHRNLLLMHKHNKFNRLKWAALLSKGLRI